MKTATNKDSTRIEYFCQERNISQADIVSKLSVVFLAVIVFLVGILLPPAVIRSLVGFYYLPSSVYKEPLSVVVYLHLHDRVIRSSNQDCRDVDSYKWYQELGSRVVWLSRFLNDRVQQGFDRKGFLGLRLSGVETGVDGLGIVIQPDHNSGGLDQARDFVHGQEVFGNKLYLKRKLVYTFYMPDRDERFSEHYRTSFNNRSDLANIEDVMATLNSKEIKERSKAKGDDGEGLYVRGRTDRRDSRQSRGKSRSKSRGGRLKCYIFQSEDHLKRNCPKNNRKKSTGYVKKDDQPSSSGSTYDDSEVMMVMSTQAQALLDLIMDSGCSYHMTPRYIPECKRNLRSAGNLEKEGFYRILQSGKSSLMASIMKEKRTVLQQVLDKDWDLSVRRDYRCWKSEGVWGPVSGGSLGGKRYFLSIIDDYSRTGDGRVRVEDRIMVLSVLSTGVFEAAYALRDGIARHLTLSGRPQPNGFAIEKKTPMKDVVDIQVIMGHVEGVKGYRLYRLDNESPKIVTSRNVVFNESVMYKDTLKDSGVGDKSVEELQVEVELQRLNNHTHEEDQEDGNDEDAGDQETNQPPDLTDYQLTRDREARTRTKPLRFQDESNMAAYAFAAAEEEDTHEPLTLPGGSCL
ncbi:hypothetical protein Tco_0636088 [Tanacetum coccineum]